MLDHDKELQIRDLVALFRRTRNPAPVVELSMLFDEEPLAMALTMEWVYGDEGNLVLRQVQTDQIEARLAGRPPLRPGEQ